MSQMAAMFDEDPAVIAAHALARERFEAMATNDVSDPQPDDPIDAIQLALMRWQRAHFGDQSSERMALGIIEEMVETFAADTANTTEGALDGLGDTCVFSSQLCTNNRLALGPVLDLARVFTMRQGAKLIMAHGVLAQVILKGAQKIRGLDDENRYRLRLVGAIAMCIAKAIDDVEIMHDLAVKPRDVLLVVAREVLARGDGHDAIPKAPPPREITPEEHERAKHLRRAKAEEQLQATIGAYDPSADAPACMECGADLRAAGDVDLFHCTADTGHVFTGMQVAAAGATNRMRAPDEAFDASEITKPE